MKVTLEVNWFAPDTAEGAVGEATDLEIDVYDNEHIRLIILGNEIIVSKAELQATLNTFSEVENAT